MPRPPLRTRQLLDPMAAFQMVHILTGVVQRGTATVLRDLDRPMFGKTGTTSGPTNVWFVGGTPEIVAGVYLGYDQPRSLGGYAQGGRIAAPIFKQFARTAFAGMPKIPFAAPAGIRWARIDRASGRLCSVPSRPRRTQIAVMMEAFQPRPSRAGRSAQPITPNKSPPSVRARPGQHRWSPARAADKRQVAPAVAPIAPSNPCQGRRRLK